MIIIAIGMVVTICVVDMDVDMDTDMAQVTAAVFAVYNLNLQVTMVLEVLEGITLVEIVIVKERVSHVLLVVRMYWIHATIVDWTFARVDTSLVIRLANVEADAWKTVFAVIKIVLVNALDATIAFAMMQLRIVGNAFVRILVSVYAQYVNHVL